MLLKPTTATAVDLALSSVSRQDQFLEQLMRDFRQISPEVGQSVATLFGRGIDQSVRLPPGNRREVGMMALLIAGAAACAADILCHLDGGNTVARIGDDRAQGTVRAFEAMLATALDVQAQNRLKKIVGTA